jgi:hypothetical protein
LVSYASFGLRRWMTESFRIEPHVCVHCMGRVLSRALPDLDDVAAISRLFRCADCGVEKEGQTPSVICTCGFKVHRRTNLGLRCESNTGKTPEFPAEIIAVECVLT